MAELFDPTPPPAIERLARIEGQSNFLSLLAGIEAGPDTTEDMAALSFARSRGVVPEVLETYVAQSGVFSRPLMSMLFNVIVSEFKPKESDYPWIRGAIADAFLLVRYGAYAGPLDLSQIHKDRRNLYRNMRACRPKAVRGRAKHFKVDVLAYGAMRKLAEGVFYRYVWDAQRQWLRCRFSMR